jgi:hypothetical protein
MSLPDSIASAALDERVIRPVWFAFIDFVGDPARANTSGADLTINGSGQPDLDGDYLGLDPRLVDVSPVKSSPGGADTVTARLSGLRGLDDDDRIALANPANWQGRTVRLWRMIRNAANQQQGGIQHYYTGYMVALAHIGSPSELTIEITIESYLAAFSEASNRTLLSQEEFDPGDLSARATIALANGNSSSPLVGLQPGGGKSGGFPGFGGLGGVMGAVAARVVRK